MKTKFPALLLSFVMTAALLAGCGRSVDPVGTDSASTAASSLASASSAEADGEETNGEETNGEETTEEWTPAAEDYSRYYEDNGFLKGITASDYVTVPDFSELVVDEEDLKTSDETIDAVITSFLEAYLYEEDTEKVIEDGDSVCIAYTGYVDGKAFDGGSTGESGTVVTIGTTQYIDDFLEQLIGHKPGDDLSIEVTFPDPYSNNTDLSGKDAVFETTILYVQTVPELTEELLAENSAYFSYYFGVEASTPEELRQSIYDTYYSYYLAQKVNSYVTEMLADTEVPDTAYECAYNEMSISLANNSMDVDTYCSYYGYTEEEFEDLIREDAKVMLLYQAIAEQENWEITEDDLREYVGEDDYDSAVESYGIGYLAQYLVYSKASNYMLDNVTIE